MLALTSFFDDPLVVFVSGLALLILFFWYFATDVDRRKRNVGSVLTIGITALCIIAATPVSEKLKGGIDIVGGSSFSLRVQPKESESGEKIPVTEQQVDQAIEVIEKRLNSMGTSEPLIARQGDDGILVQMPGVEPEESKRIEETLEKVAKLELREVHPQSDMLAARVASGEEIVPGYLPYKYKHKDADGNELTTDILLNRRMALGGSNIVNASPSAQQADAVQVTLDGEGEDKMINLTKNMRIGQDRLAIVLDGEVKSAPVVNAVLGKNFIVEGLNEPGEVQNLASALMNPLENPLVVEAKNEVSPTLGAAIVQQGIWAGLAGLAITALFVLIYYRFAGIISLIGLGLNAVILFGVMAMFGFTFSLPGIAGMILIIGMAVDANVLIYERLREEIQAGKSLRNAIDAAYDKAFSAIFDSNITSLITALILFALGSGAIKGFAVTLTIGLLASMFSAILVTRVLYRWGVDLKLITKLTFLDLIKSANFDFLGKRRICAMLSLVLIVVACSGFFIRKERSLGVDFTGGTLIEFQLGKDLVIPVPEVEKALTGMKLNKTAYPQEQSNPATGTILSIRCDSRDTENIIAKLRETIPSLGEVDSGQPAKDGVTNYKVDASQKEVSAVIGGHFLRGSVIALVIGVLGIVIYMTIRFEFSFALGGMVALMHDIIIAVGFVVLIGEELSLIHVGAILTIAGYSINDTIIVFDRIRENLLTRGGSIKELMNEAINATLSRTLLTSSTTIVTVLLLAVLGGSNLRDFSMTILSGLVVGTYSSIFVAAPIVLWWSRRKKGRDLRDDVLATKEAADAAAAAP
ncbi:MAG: protein translocase subunit SecD [Akkermansiaceae bacterium]|nr:protein translocase subunit SecD [Akkermansiaceae bacterium]MCP5543914.1 protein translocase subunit SecD [Akkermansiaceae bacterium]MCP5547546.1 protein translocase subunit SecD [Akkermansiaceae bacterium]